MKRISSEISQGKMDYSINCVVTMRQPPGKTDYIRTNSKWIKDLDIKTKK